MAELPTQVKELIGEALERGGDSLIYLDPARENERRAIEYFLERSGKSQERYPALHAAIAGGGVGVPATPLDRCTLVDAGQTEDGTATARTWVGSAGRAYISGAHTMLLDSDTGSVLASGSRTQVGGGLVRNSTDADALAATPRMTGVSFFHAQRSPSEPVRFGLSAEQVATTSEVTYTIEEPVEVTHKHKPGHVVIGMARQQGWINTDCDYVYPEAANVEPDRLVVPFSGSAEFPVGVKLPAQNIRTWLWCQHTPLGVLQTVAKLEAGFKQAAANRISWRFPFDDVSIRLTKSLQFEPLPEADENISAFYFRFQVVGAEGKLQTATICSATWPDKPTTGCGSVLDLEYWWHCVQADARVTLADGSSRQLQEIDNRTEVRKSDGSNALVEATTLDIHDVDSEDPIVKLETAGGRSLVLSVRHPLFVGGAPVTAGDLQPGQEIAVEGGTDRVASCVPFPSYSGFLGNLKLAGSGTQAFFANGIAVGDFSTLAAHTQEISHDPDYRLARLPESNHQDFLSALADAAAR